MVCGDTEKACPLQPREIWEQFGEDMPEKGVLCQFIKNEQQLAKHRIEKEGGNACKYGGE